MNFDSTQDDNRDESLLNELAALPKSRTPDHDAWPEISRRIASEKVHLGANKGSNMRGWLALAASLLLVAVSSVFMLNGYESSVPPVPPTAEARSEHLPLNEIGVRVPANSLEREYQAAFREFASLNAAYAGLPGVERTAIQKDWQLMQELEQELKAALKLDPESRWLAQQLVSLRERQLQLLHVIADTGHMPGRNLI